MRTLVDARMRWEITLDDKPDLASLKAAVKGPASSNPSIIGLRSVCWKIFLLFEELDTSSWKKILVDTRSAYKALKTHYLSDVSNSADLTAEDPLSDKNSSRWTALEQDEELRAEIFQDVERCMPEYSYFREPATQTMLLDILFIYCKLNQDISYRQGMHEVLAPLLWVVYCDAVDAVEQDAGDEADLISMCLDSAHIEHDTFTLFGAVMQTAKSFYEIGDAYNPVSGGSLSTESPIVGRSKRIHEHYLQHADPELAEHLAAIEVLPQVFLIRWIRLIFGREFAFDDVLLLWDVLFAEDPTLDIVDLVSVSMLLRIRWQLLEEDYTGALTLLLRYPTPAAPHGPSTFVSDAIYLRDNLLLDGGDRIIAKYSNKSPETTVTRKLPRRLQRARTSEQEAAATTTASRHGILGARHDKGVETIIQDAARGLYNTGERWGVAKVIKNAVHGLQASNTTQVKDLSGPESLDTKTLLHRIQTLEQRNSALSRILAKVLDDLWVEEKERAGSTTNSEPGPSDSLSFVIAKIQFVQVYLENPSMQLPTEGEALSADKDQLMATPPSNPNPPAPPLPSSETLDGLIDEKPLSVRSKPKGRRSPTRAKGVSEEQDAPTTPTRTSHKIRPSLSESPYSWMLGDEVRKSDFVRRT